MSEEDWGFGDEELDSLNIPDIEIEYQPISDEDDCPDGACKI